MRSRRIFGAIQRILSSVLVRCESARRSRLSCALALAVHSTSATGTRRKRAVTPSFDYRSWLAQPCLSHQNENEMLDQTTNDLLTHVGPNTPCGNLLRRYWHPVGYSSELTGLGRTKRVRILGEDLVLARIGSGALLLVQERCPHRGASLLYGFVEGTNIRCAYHGWLYNQAGEC